MPNFLELRYDEVRRIPLPRTRVNSIGGTATDAHGSGPVKGRVSSVSPSGNVGNPVPTVRATLEAEGANLSKRDIRLYLDGAEQRRFYYGRATGNLSYHPGMLSSGTHTVEIVATAGQGSSTSKKSWTFSVS
jgi:hypothetical protein